MPERRLILHIGAPKCGSTALQSILACTPVFSRHGAEQFRYGVVDRAGKLHLGEAVRKRAAKALSGGAPSAGATLLRALPRETRDELAASLNQALSTTSVILSKESWLIEADAFNALELLEQVDAPVDAVAYVRPQADFLNASWWQWGAWSDEDFAPWMARQAHSCRWGALVGAWRALPNVRRVHARLLPEDVVKDFFSLLGVAAPGGSAANQSLPGLALRFLQRHRELRPGPHDSNIHFVLGRALNQMDGEPPWVLPTEFVKQVVAASHADNTLLRALLDPDCQPRMDQDPRWWNAVAYSHKQQQSPERLPANLEEAEQLALALAQRLLQTERELAVLRRKAPP